MQQKKTYDEFIKTHSSSSSDEYKNTNPFKNAIIGKDDPFFETDFKPQTITKIPLKPLKKTQVIPLKYFTIEEDRKLIQIIKTKPESVSINAACLQYAKDSGRSHDSVRTRYKKFLSNLSDLDCI